MKTLVVAALVIASVGVAEPAAPAVGKPPPLPRHRIAEAARRMAHSLGDPSVRQAFVYETTHRTAADVLFRETDPRGDSRRATGPWVFVIMIRGHFICRACSRPAGVKPQRGRVAYSVWSPHLGTLDFGLTPKLPKYLARLGRPVRVAVRAP